MKKVYYFLLFIVLIGAIATLLSLPRKVQVQTLSINQKDNTFDITAQYPQFSNINRSFNLKIENLVTNQIEEFKKNSQDNLQAFEDTATPEEKKNNPWVPFVFDCGWAQTRIDDNYISFKLDVYSFAGGAHGINQTFAFNYNVKNQQEITIKDLLGNSQDNLNKLAEVVQKITIDQLKNSDIFVEDMAKEGTAPTFENYKNFNFDKDNLIIYFQQYQVAPGSAGPVTIKVPLTLVKEFAKLRDI